jgi:hypothetical protein
MEIKIDGFYVAEDYALLSKFFGDIAELRRLREKEVYPSHNEGPQEEPYIPPLPGPSIAQTLDAAKWTGATALEAAQPAKRTRRTKAQIEADEAAEKAAQQNISSTPEDRQDPAVDEEPEVTTEEQPDLFDDEAAEEDDLIDGYAVTGEGLVAAMKAYVAKFDMAAAQNNAKILFGGYTKRSEVTAAGPAAIATAIRNFSNAVNTGKAA